MDKQLIYVCVSVGRMRKNKTKHTWRGLSASRWVCVYMWGERVRWGGAGGRGSSKITFSLTKVKKGGCFLTYIESCMLLCCRLNHNLYTENLPVLHPGQFWLLGVAGQAECEVHEPWPRTPHPQTHELPPTRASVMRNATLSRRVRFRRRGESLICLWLLNCGLRIWASQWVMQPVLLLCLHTSLQ